MRHLLGGRMRAARSTEVRSSSSTPPPSTLLEPVIGVFELDKGGALSRSDKTLEDFKRLKRETKLPIRDMRIFFSRGDAHGLKPDSLPVILSRPSSNCFLLHLDSIKLLCLRDSCLLLHSDDAVVSAFVGEMQRQLRAKEAGRADGEDEERRAQERSRMGDSQMHIFLDALTDTTEQKFEATVLEVALSTVSKKYRRQLNLLRPMLDVLLQETTANPSAAALRRMLAFRKSLGAFEINVVSARSAVKEVLAEEEDLAGLCLSAPLNTEASSEMTEELELLFEAYNADLKEVEQELAMMKEQIEDTNDFIKIHLDTIRNHIIKLSLFMDMGTLSVGGGALLTGIFGMNLLNSLESHPSAFLITGGGVVCIVGSLFSMFSLRFFALRRDYSSAKSYQALKHFFQYVENVENAVQMSEGKGLDRTEFRHLLEPLIDVQLTKAEVDTIFKLLDNNRDGTLDSTDLSKALRSRSR